MPTFVALLRGINVGGRRKVLMNDLRESLADLSFKNIETYVQSGNIVFDSRSKDESKIAIKIKKMIAAKFGHEVPVVVRSAESFTKIASTNPLLKSALSESQQLHVTFLHSPPKIELLKSLQSPPKSNCEFKITGEEVFVRCAVSYSKTKLNNTFFESKLKVPCTTRNWKTVSAINEIIGRR